MFLLMSPSTFVKNKSYKINLYPSIQVWAIIFCNQEIPSCPSKPWGGSCTLLPQFLHWEKQPLHPYDVIPNKSNNNSIISVLGNWRKCFFMILSLFLGEPSNLSMLPSAAFSILQVHLEFTTNLSSTQSRYTPNFLILLLPLSLDVI